MTTKEFFKISSFNTVELSIDVIAFDIKMRNLTPQDISESDKEIFNREIQGIDFITSGDNSGESYLDITIYV
jgi:hypothetical protein